MRTIFIQKKKGEFLNTNCFEAFDCYDKIGIDEIQFFERFTADLDDKLYKFKSDPLDTMVVGSVYYVQSAIEYLGKQVVPCDYPSQLERFLGRRIYSQEMWEFKKYMNDSEFSVPLFVKPKNKTKLFNGILVKSFADLIPLSGISDETEVFVSEKIDFISEWRVFVLRGQIIGIKHYKGNCWIMPSKFEIEQMIGVYHSLAPAAYALDVGVVKSEGSRISYEFDTKLVEVNDAFALGTYGLPGIRYCQMMDARWNEIFE